MSKFVQKFVFDPSLKTSYSEQEKSFGIVFSHEEVRFPEIFRNFILKYGIVNMGAFFKCIHSHEKEVAQILGWSESDVAVTACKVEFDFGLNFPHVLDSLKKTFSLFD